MEKEKSRCKKRSKKMIMFLITVLVLFIFFLINTFTVKSDEQGKMIIWGVVITGVGAMTNKFLDDWQRGKNFNKDLYNGE